MTKKYTDILFDLDNTLLDFDHASKMSFNRMMTAYGEHDLIPRYNTYQEINGNVWAMLERGEISQMEVRTLRWELVWEHFGRTHDSAKSNVDYLNGLVDFGKWIDGAETILSQIKQNGLNIYLITNGFREVQRARILKEKLDKISSGIVISDEIGYSKPNPKFFDHLFENHPKLDKSNCLIVGDSLNSDILGGHKYGIDTCWFNPNASINKKEWGPNMEIGQLSKLTKILGI